MSFYTEFGKSKEKYRKYRPAYPDTLFTGWKAKQLSVKSISG